MTDTKGTTPAPPGQVYVCGACGKRSRTRYGFDEENKPMNIDRGWDESCMLNAVLCYDEQPWRAVEDVPRITLDTRWP